MTMNEPVVIVRDGSAYADSRDVAMYFDKNHSDVARAVRNLHCSDEFRASNFAVCEEKQELTSGGATRSVYHLMTKNGFTFLVMGFTGKEAARFKEAYIARFDQMERELRDRDDEEVTIIGASPATEARMLVGEARRTFGHKAAQQLWGQLGLPVVPAMLIPAPQTELSFSFAVDVTPHLRAA